MQRIKSSDVLGIEEQRRVFSALRGVAQKQYQDLMMEGWDTQCAIATVITASFALVGDLTAQHLYVVDKLEDGQEAYYEHVKKVVEAVQAEVNVIYESAIGQ